MKKNTDLAFGYRYFRKAATEYANVAEELRNMAERFRFAYTGVERSGMDDADQELAFLMRMTKCELEKIILKNGSTFCVRWSPF